MLSRIRDSYPFVILLFLIAAFAAFRYANLGLPLFWDEAWVYGPAIRSMAKNGISLLPGALPDSISRGHPLLFHVAGALWVRAFGPGLFSLHSFALIITLCFALTFYYIIKKITDAELALIVTAISLAQPMIIAQSSIVLPEIFLTLWAVLCIFHFVRNNRFYYFISGTALVLTKESGAVIIVSIIIFELIRFIVQKPGGKNFREFAIDFSLTLAPLLPLAFFLIIQHHQRGYYLYPEHLARLNFNWITFQEKLRLCYDTLFVHQGRIFITVSFLFAFALFFKKIPLAVRLILVLFLMACVKIFFHYWPLPDWLMILVISAVSISYYYFVHIKYKENSQAGTTLAILFITGAFFLVFSAVNFFSDRYLLMLVPLMTLYFSYYIKKSLYFNSYLPLIWAFLITSLLIYKALFYNTTNDDSPQYVDGVKLEKMIVLYLEEQNLENSNIHCTFNMENALKDDESGYLSENKIFSKASADFGQNTEYVIQTNVEIDPPLDDFLKKQNSGFYLVKTFNSGIAKGNIYKRE